ncbi:hypothetical protein A2159_01870 [Candidatus Woesebacteria bacterium RBG_13_34_9]|uniref:Uncharacterized protein n=1 Tax=Candidatus Woesebacteria bacterium RBG_13_34_9 TaxID=1802477 RepID=A0A1F7WZD2_9BACT|nr:MAG: hypothetical protein A2159_01870 [Candidatus Woesebacteria bacterium RBG_13_34_9]
MVELSEEEKKRIEAEEIYRAKVREEIKEEKTEDVKPKKKGLSCLSIIVILIVFFAFLSLVIKAINHLKPIEITKQQTETQSVNPIFDVPSLIGKDLDGISAILGTPQGQDPTKLQIQQGVKQWDKVFNKDGKELLVTYTITDKKIVDFFISTDDPSGKTTDKTHLLQLGNLIEYNSKYTVEFVKAIEDPSSFTGVKIIPR